MSTNDTPDLWSHEAPPVYCGVCGDVLLDEVFHRPQGFDRMTGRPKPDWVVNMRTCPKKGHDSWLLPGSHYDA